jgi:hypothetical protein
MQRSNNVFVMLANQAEAGDSTARVELCRHLEPQLVHIVRRVICEGPGHSSVDRRIVAEARRVGLNAELAASADGELLIRTVARTVSNLLAEGTRAKPKTPFNMQETVRT